MSYLDDIIGEMLDLYKINNLWNNTSLILSTDDGGTPYWSPKPNVNDITRSCGCNVPYRAGKATMFEGGIKSVGFISGGQNIMPQSLRATQFNKLMPVIAWLSTMIGSVLNN